MQCSRRPTALGRSRGGQTVEAVDTQCRDGPILEWKLFIEKGIIFEKDRWSYVFLPAGRYVSLGLVEPIELLREPSFKWGPSSDIRNETDHDPDPDDEEEEQHQPQDSGKLKIRLGKLGMICQLNKPKKED